jgi:1,4-dihydroxy-2-naphthoyl-CoA hydrolase
MLTVEHLNRIGAGKLPHHLGMTITSVSESEVVGVLPVIETLMAPNGFLHAGAVVTLADTCAGYGCVGNLPHGASGFTTVELKSNHLGTARDGHIVATAQPVHLGKTTQVWDVVVMHRESGRKIALFRCTQLILYPKQEIS